LSYPIFCLSFYLSPESPSSPTQVAIITGVSSGIGLVTTNSFLSSGWRVLGVDFSPAPPSIIENASFKSKFNFVQTDITQHNAAGAIVSACQSAFGSRIDALINVAGIIDKNAGVDNLQDEDWDRVIAVNLTAPIKLMREVINVMKVQKSGCIVNVASKAGTSGAVSGVAYTSSKHGLVGAVTIPNLWFMVVWTFDHADSCQ